MRRWKPQNSPGLVIAAVLLGAVLAGTIFFGYRLTIALARPPEQWPVDLGLFLHLVALTALLAATGILIYLIVGRITLAYEIDRNGLYIHWLGNRAVVPLSRVESVESGISGVRMPTTLFQGIGYYRGRGRTPDGKPLHLFTTRSPANSLILDTGEAAYAIAPAERDAFVQELEQRRQLGATLPLNTIVETGQVISYPFWRDLIVRWAVPFALLLNLAVIGIAALYYPELPVEIPLRYDAAGAVAELRPRHQLLFLPLAGLVIWLLNVGLGLTIYQREADGARLLQIGSVVAQILFAVAVLTILL